MGHLVDAHLAAEEFALDVVAEDNVQRVGDLVRVRARARARARVGVGVGVRVRASVRVGARGSVTARRATKPKYEIASPSTHLVRVRGWGQGWG